MSESERTEPHLLAVFELIVKQHPSFTRFIREDAWYGWAQKQPGRPRSYEVAPAAARSERCWRASCGGSGGRAPLRRLDSDAWLDDCLTVGALRVSCSGFSVLAAPAAVLIAPLPRCSSQQALLACSSPAAPRALQADDDRPRLCDGTNVLLRTSSGRAGIGASDGQRHRRHHRPAPRAASTGIPKIPARGHAVEATSKYSHRCSSTCSSNAGPGEGQGREHLALPDDQIAWACPLRSPAPAGAKAAPAPRLASRARRY